MDSEVVTNANEIMSTQQQVVKDEIEKSEPGSEIVRDETDVKIAESKADGVVENGDTSTATAIVIIRKDNAKQEEETEADPQIEAETTTIVVTKNENESAHVPDKESESPRETTVTAVVLKNEKEPTETSDKESESATTTTAIFVLPNKEEIKTDKIEIESSPKADVPSNAKNTAIEALVEDDNERKEAVVADENEEADEYDEEEDESVDDDDGEDLKTGTKTEEIEDEQGQSKIPEKSEVANATKINQDENAVKTNKDINNQIENIISDIDINIKAQEKITQLKEQELQLIQKQKDLANQIQQQQLLAQKLIAENQLKEQELQRQKYLQQQQLQQQQRLLQQQQSHHQYKEEVEPLIKKDQCNTGMFQHQADSTELQESSNISRTVDLRKIFTPATDAPQILPKNRKLYASSAFYSPTLHPTVEDQVELARRISHSLSDISNQTSKGQTMYVNRKKRSVKWVHEGCGQGEDGDIIETHSLSKENAVDDLLQPELIKLDKMPLKLVMNPRGQMRDYNSLKESINIESGLLSPDNCAELITALQLHKGRGAELFAKRRRKADNWVVDETNAGTHSPSGIPDYQQYQTNRPSVTSPSIVPAYSDAGKHRVQLNLHQDRLIEKYSKCGVQVVKSPWEAALQTGSASTAFLDQSEFQSQTPIATQPSPVNFTQDFTDSPSLPASYTNPSDYAQDSYKSSSYDTRGKSQPIQSSNPQRELAYKPNVAQGWGGRNVELPKGLYVPKEISLASYAPPPVQSTPNILSSPKTVEYDAPPYAGFPVANTKSGLYNSVPPKQQLYNPTSYQKVPSSSQQAGLQVNYSPSPLSYNKLSKFQESADQRNQRYLNVKKQPAYRGVQNVSPTPFLSDGAGGHDNRLPYNVESQQIWRGGNQSFNSCARGWNKETNNIKRNVYSPRTVSIPATENLPYSDF